MADAYIEIIDKYVMEDPQQVLPELENLIDFYCERFWNLPAGQQAELETDLNMRTRMFGNSSVTTEDWSKEGTRNAKLREELTNEYKAYLKSKLYAINGSLLNEYAGRLEDPVRKAVNKQLDAYYNKPFGLKIIQPEKKVGDETVCPYDGYKVRLKHITDVYKKNCLDQMTVTLQGPETTYVNSMTVLGHINSGGSLELDFWAPDQDPDKDDPEFTKEFSLNEQGFPVPIQLEEQVEEIDGEFSIILQQSLEEGMNNDNINSVSDAAGILFLDDIFASNTNNIGQPAAYYFDLIEEDEETYIIQYSAQQGNTVVRYQGSDYVFDWDELMLTADIYVHVADAEHGDRDYQIRFELMEPDDEEDEEELLDEGLVGTMTIYRNKKVFASYDIRLEPNE